ncbi:polyubiquitin [Tanacetum coccineum]
MRIRALMALNESPLRPKVQHTRSTRMSKQILNKAKVPHRAYIMTKGKWLRYGIKEKNGPPLVVKLRGGIPMDRQRLVLYGKRLSDDRCLADCDVREGSTLDLVILR